MLSNTDYAAIHRVPATFENPEFDDFAAFTVEFKSGKKKCHLWDVKPHGQESVSRMVKRTIAEKKSERLALLEKYIQQGWAFESPEGVTMEDYAEDSWGEQ